MTFNELTFFVKCCETQNFTTAANDLCISVQGLSKAIKHLENELGAPLFNRVASGAIPTHLGQMMYPKAKSIISEMGDLSQFVSSSVTQNQDFNLCIRANYWDLILSDLLKEYYKDTEVNINCSILPNDLLENTHSILLTSKSPYDFSFSIASEIPEDLSFLPLYDLYYYPVISKKYSSYDTVNFKTSNLADFEVLISSFPSGQKTATLSKLQELGVSPKFQNYYNYENAPLLFSRGKCLIWAPLYSINMMLRISNDLYVPKNFPVLSLPFGIIYKPGNEKINLIKEAAQYLTEWCSDPANFEIMNPRFD